ncbi:MAG: 3-deoxy-7-phosphoheptulonate synthase [Planctomycetes bacterium]|nr:3-deoxy-7-phosphoheptulonate synthase [Planctomycetota bacterium]
MIIILDGRTPDPDLRGVLKRLEEKGFRHDVSRGEAKIIIGAIGVPDAAKANLAEQLSALSCVERVIPIMKPYKRVARDFRPEGTQVKVGDLALGGPRLHVMAGPCSVESRAQILEVAQAVKEAGATILRGGAFKPRTLPYDFQGLGEPGLEFLAEAREKTGLKIVTEVMDPRDVKLVVKYADILQLGARNMQNFPLLRQVGKVQTPVLFKRGMSATIDEWMKAAEYILSGGNEKVILCERGIRSFDSQYTRNCFDLAAVPVVKSLTHLPIIADPSHGTGVRSLIAPMARAAVASGADGLMIEVHPEPSKALSDGQQSLTPREFASLMKEVRRVCEAVGRCL